MDAASIFRQGYNTYAQQVPRQNPYTAARFPRKPSPARGQFDVDDSASHPARIAHTLTACCRCRQRKTRCDPTLPRCLPCERSGSICEYYDATKGRKIGRNYVVKLQEKVRRLEAELSNYTDEENDHPRSNEDVVRPGGLVRLSDSDETPRYLGPSSGIAMTRLLMEQAKSFTDSNRISELIPEVRARRQTRMQSIVMANNPKRKKSYPVTSAHPAKALPARHVADRLVAIFSERSQIFWPTLHETQFLKDLEDVFAGSKSAYQNFVVRMVFAISLQKLDVQYAGLADSYYLAAMDYFQVVIRCKDLKTLQCLALIGQYSLLTPTRMAIYSVVGLATRICQSEGLTDEKTISAGYSMGLMDPMTLDMRRRLAYVTGAMELGLAHSMGRPNGLAKGDDFMDVKFFETVDDEYITADGILPGPPSDKKLVAIHFIRMRLIQAEIKRFLYEKKRPEPKNETHPWFSKMERQIQEWLDNSPENPPWCKPWFSGRAHQMRIFLHRPCPQIPKPSSRAAAICFESAAYIINLSRQQMEKAAVDITWVFLLNLFMALNALLWTVSFAEIRQAHTREEVDELVQVALDIIDQEQCTQRWPGSESASNLYSIFAKACLQVYDAREASAAAPTASHFNTPSSLFDTNSPQGSENSATTAASFKPHAPQLGTVFDATPEAMNNYGYDGGDFQPPQPTFRSNSIFMSPPTTDPMGRRYSAYPPESPLDNSTPPGANPSAAYQASISPPEHLHDPISTPPDTLAASLGSAATPGSAASTISPPPGAVGTPTIPQTSPPVSYTSQPMGNISTNMSPPPPPKAPAQPQPPQRGPAFTVQPNIQQRPLPQPDGITDWFSPPPPFINPYSFSPMSNSFFSDSPPQGNAFNVQAAGLGLGQFNIGPFSAQPMGWNPERQGSLSQEQQLELLNALENEGLGEIDAFLDMGTGTGGQGTRSNGWA